jgi:Tol biopolymer transport system component
MTRLGQVFGAAILCVPVFFAFFLPGSNMPSEEFPVLRGAYLGQKPPGDKAELFAPGIVSHCTQHSSAYFSPDGKEVYFSRMLPLPSVIMYMKEENGIWTKPRIAVKGLTPFLSPDGKKLYFSRDWALWVAEKTKNGWTEPKNLGNTINFQKRQDGPSVANDGTVYFCSMYGNHNGIYRAELKDGLFAEREKLGSGINSSSVDGMPYIAPDESYLIFTSFRSGSIGMSDLYISFRDSHGTWTTPKNMGPKINSEVKEGYPYVTVDGKYFFFYSNRVSVLNRNRIPDGPGNVYWIDAKIIRELKPNLKK